MAKMNDYYLPTKIHEWTFPLHLEIAKIMMNEVQYIDKSEMMVVGGIVCRNSIQKNHLNHFHMQF